jgi:hypothetical protein
VQLLLFEGRRGGYLGNCIAYTLHAGHELPSVPPVFAGAAYSWSGKTLAISHAGPVTVWVSTNDGDTWVDESADYSALTGGISQWYDNTLYVASLGQGIVAKVFNESAY